MIVALNTQALRSLDDVRAFLDGNGPVDFVGPTGTARYRWLEATLRQFDYPRLKRADKGLLKAYVRKVTGYSRAQTTRLLAQWQQQRRIRDRRGPPARPFRRRFTDADVRLLAELERMHGQLSGPATKKLRSSRTADLPPQAMPVTTGKVRG
ncbi:hypothetical protein [Pseudoxanthomonas mexicana]